MTREQRFALLSLHAKPVSLVHSTKQGLDLCGCMSSGEYEGDSSGHPKSTLGPWGNVVALRLARAKKLKCKRTLADVTLSIRVNVHRVILMVSHMITWLFLVSCSKHRFDVPEKASTTASLSTHRIASYTAGRLGATPTASQPKFKGILGVRPLSGLLFRFALHLK